MYDNFLVHEAILRQLSCIMLSAVDLRLIAKSGNRGCYGMVVILGCYCHLRAVLGSLMCTPVVYHLPAKPIFGLLDQNVR